MTYREKLQKDHPNRIGDQFCGGAALCPKSYVYEEIFPCEDAPEIITCRECWNRKVGDKVADKRQRKKL